eukprot:6218325-Lingulodinium_polyedra.AAC.1
MQRGEKLSYWCRLAVALQFLARGWLIQVLARPRLASVLRARLTHVLARPRCVQTGKGNAVQ